jgi:uncharacterized protein YneF (UPF0154 family)
MKENDTEIDLETRLMMAEIGLKVAESRINNLMRKIDMLIRQNGNRE